MTIPAVDSRITDVTVFQFGALITRVAELEPGDAGFPEQLRLAGLPLSLEDDSVRVRMAAADLDGSASPTASDARVVLEVPPADPSLAPPTNEELREARVAVRQIEERIAQYRETMTRLAKLGSPARPEGRRGTQPPPSPTEARLALADFRSRRLDELGSQLRDQHLKLHDAREHLAEVEHRHRTATSARQAREHELRKSVIVSLGAVAPDVRTRCQLIVEYMVPGARWAPSYSLRLAADYSHAELALRAQVCQATDEDWTGVRLTLSTARAQRWTELPELPALRIGRLQPRPPRTGWREPPEGAEALFADYDRARRAAAEEALQAQRAEEEKRAAVAAAEAYTRAEHLAAEPEEAEKEMEALAEQDLLLGELAGAVEEEAMEVEAPMAVAAAVMDAEVPRAVRPSAAKMKKARPRTAAPPPPVREEIVAELAAPADLLGYGQLRMRGCEELARGSLRPAPIQETYLELLAQLHIEVNIDVVVVVQAAHARAALVKEKAPPPGHVFPTSWEGYDHAYRAEARVDIPSDGSFHGVPLLARPATTELRYVAVPREAREVFRFVEWVNPLTAPLPEGPVDVYLGSDLLLTSRLRTVAPSGTAELGLGVEEAIKVARNTRFEESSTGLLGGGLRLEHSIDVELANHLQRPAAVEVRERVPIAREGDEQVQVEVTEVAPPWKNFEQDRRPIEGSYRWRVTVAPGGSEHLRARYAVTIPSKSELVGGNRREH
jgi:uncharacterized protein (TIGR02231 family)